MTGNSMSLPRFKKPPVVETVLGVHFRPLEKFGSAHPRGFCGTVISENGFPNWKRGRQSRNFTSGSERNGPCSPLPRSVGR